MNPSRAFSFFVAALVSAPIAVIFSSFLTPADHVWRHFSSTILGELVANTFVLAIAVAAGTTVTGVGLAWLTAVCEFPGRRFFSWALLLPLALPAYVIGFVAIGLLDFTGPLQTALRSLTGSTLPWFPPIRSRGGVILVMTMALYPYVYLLAKNAFQTQGRRLLEAGRALGLTAPQAFWRVALPMARPWIAAGAMLVVMETIADFGTVAVFNYDTLTSGVYKAWFGLFSITAAAQVASILILIAFVVLLMEQLTRRRMRFASIVPQAATARIVLAGADRWIAIAACLLVFATAFAAPALQIIIWSAKTGFRDFDARLLGYLWHSVALGIMATVVVTTTALLLGYAARRNPGPLTRLAIKFATVGYAVPGAVLAVGIFVVFAWTDRLVPDTVRAVLGLPPGMLLQGSVTAMLVAYLIRFLAVGVGPVESAMHRITRNMDEAAIALGHARLRLLARIHLPLLRAGLATAAILVFVDVMKEMPITLMTRPFGWDTLAVRIFELTSEGDWERAAIPALILALAGIMPVLHLTRASEWNRNP
ncbi:MAG TPA: iron ABC transporter permease [Burkholderiales bacterium]